MWTGDLIDRTISYVDNLDPAVGDHTKRRARYLQDAQEGVNDELWMNRYWAHTKKTFTPVTIADQQSSVALPADFMEVGRDGKVFITALGDQGELTEQADDVIQRLQMSGIPTSQPEVYSIFDSDLAGLPKLQTQKVAGAVSLTIFGRKNPPILVDSKISGSGLEQIPVRLQFSVMIPYMRFRGFDHIGDARADKWEKRFRKALAEAEKVEKMGKEDVKQMAGYGLSEMC